MSFIYFVIITIVDAAVLTFLIPKFIGDSSYREAPDFPTSLSQAGIANGIGWIGYMAIGFHYGAWAYYCYYFWHKLGLNRLAVVVCMVAMIVCEILLGSMIHPILFPPV